MRALTQSLVLYEYLIFGQYYNGKVLPFMFGAWLYHKFSSLSRHLSPWQVWCYFIAFLLYNSNPQTVQLRQPWNPIVKTALGVRIYVFCLNYSHFCGIMYLQASAWIFLSERAFWKTPTHWRLYCKREVCKYILSIPLVPERQQIWKD